MGAVSGQKQHVEINRKLAIRRWLLPKAAPGALYLPYCGEGDHSRPALSGVEDIWVRPEGGISHQIIRGGAKENRCRTMGV